MSALGDVAAAILPPEAGGPDPERVASVARRMVSRMPGSSQAGLGAGLVGLEAFSLARTGRPLGRRRQSSAKRCCARSPASAARRCSTRLKSVVMLAHGADTFAAEIAAVGSRHEPSRPDPQMAVVAGGGVATQPPAATRSWSAPAPAAPSPRGRWRGPGSTP